VGRLAAAVEAQRPQLALWSPVFFSFGIGLYFALPGEPKGWMLAALGAVCLLGLGVLVRSGPLGRVLLLAILIPAAGLGTAALRSLSVAAPVLPYAMTVNVEGRVIDLDRSASDRPRILLDRVVIYGFDPARTPGRVRISLDPATPSDVLRPGMRLIGQARLTPPPGPSEPGGFDFRQLAWFEGIGAVGYTNTPLLEAGGSDATGLRQAAFRARMALSAFIRARVPGQSGAFAAAILTGDRSAIDREIEAALRVSNLYHLVSISGLHMSLLAAAVFAIVRYGLATIPRLALNWPLKKIAACAAMVVGAAYLFISGAQVPTQRAFVMTATVLVAVLLDRPALTMRAVALAALIVLVMAPESLTQAGFQMSFAATTALVAAFEALRRQAWWRHTQSDPRWRLVKPVLGVAMTSLVAGFATAPFSAFHFNAISQYGLLANLLGVPAMGIVVMPAAVIAGLLAPLGLSAPAFWVMGVGIDYILEVARFVAGLDAAARAVHAGPSASLVLITLGGLFTVLWLGRWRMVGVVPVAAGFALWMAADRPDILVSEDGRLFGIRTEAGRVVNTPRGNGFAARNWLDNDGDLAGQDIAHARPGMERRRGWARAEVPGLGPMVYLGTGQPEGDSAQTCAEAAILLAPRWRSRPEGPCLFVGADLLRREGALAIRVVDGRSAVEGAKSRNSSRPWTRDPRDAERSARPVRSAAVQ
jgi:competence protein ComEC